MTWRERAAVVIAEATKDCHDDMELKERIKVVDGARPHWGGAHWPQKAWQAARRDYLVRYGYKPKTKKAVVPDAVTLPLFE